MEDKLEDDYEQTDEEFEKSQVNFLEKKQRELLTSTIDYNLGSLNNLIIDGKINLSPDYQRRLRWDDKRKSKLIESFFMNVVIPPVFLNEDNFGKYSVIDGKQRLSAISDFLSGKFALRGLEVFRDLNGLKFNKIPPEYQDSLNTRSTLRTIIILRQSDRDIKSEVFHRLNTGGVHLNAQEIRNNIYSGSLNNLIMKLTENELYINLLGIKTKEKSKLYQEMQDAELVLRFFALKDNWEKYSGGLKKVLDSFMEDNKKMKELEMESYKKSFLQTIENVQAVFGEEGAFRKWEIDKEKWKLQISAPIFDAQMFSLYKKDKNKLAANKEKIIREYQKLFNNDKFLDTIESSTSSSDKFLLRINLVNEIIVNII